MPVSQPGDHDRVNPTPGPRRRIELGVLLPADASEKQIRRVLSYVSGQSRFPWSEYAWLGDGHTMPYDAWPDARFAFSALSAKHLIMPRVEIPDAFGDPVTLLWMVPITKEERALAKRRTTQKVLADLPRERW